MPTDGRTDMSKLIVAFRNFANVFLCSFFYRQATEKLFVVKKWAVREDFLIVKRRVEDVSLVNSETTLLPHLHIKLGL